MRAPSWPHSARPFVQQLGLLARVVGGRKSLLPRVVLVDPRQEILRPQLGEREHQIGEVALGVDEEGGDAVDRRLLEQGEAQTGLAAARHAHAHCVGDEVLRVVEHEPGLRLPRRQIPGASEVEDAELLEVGAGRHGRRAGRRASGRVYGPWTGSLKICEGSACTGGGPGRVAAAPGMLVVAHPVAPTPTRTATSMPIKRPTIIAILVLSVRSDPLGTVARGTSPIHRGTRWVDALASRRSPTPGRSDVSPVIR